MIVGTLGGRSLVYGREVVSLSEVANVYTCIMDTLEGAGVLSTVERL